MRYTIHVRADAEIDIEETVGWYELQCNGLGSKFLDEVQRTFNEIAENPYMYGVVHRFTRRALMYRFPFGIFYRAEEKSVVVIAVMHGSRHPKKWRSRL